MLQSVKKEQKTRGIKSTSINGNTVEMRAVSQNVTLINGERGFITPITFDFENVPLENVYLAASEYALIEWRRKTFKESETPESEVAKPIDAEKYLPVPKVSYKEAAADFVFASLTKAEIQARLDAMEDDEVSEDAEVSEDK